jgi:hypothetical protein
LVNTDVNTVSLLDGAVAVDSSGFVYTYVFYLSFVYSLVTRIIIILVMSAFIYTL